MYTVTNLRPFLLPCGDTLCEQCYQDIQDQQKNKLKCPFDYQIYTIPDQPILNKSLFAMIKPEIEIPITCNLHPQNEASFYCYIDEQMICLECKITHENGMENQARPDQIHSSSQHIQVQKNELENYCKKLDFKISEMISYVEGLRTKMKEQILSQVRISNEEFMGNIKRIQEILKPINQDETSQGALKFLSKTIVEIKVYQETFDSMIVPKQYNIEAKQTLESWLGFQANLELLYRGSRDGFLSDTFHQFCDYQGPTLTLIKSDHNKIFGGYASLSWSSKDKWQHDNNAFLFSLTNQTKHPIVKNKHQAMMCSSRGYMTVFGGGDLQIYDRCDQQNDNNFSDLGACYELPKGMKYMDKEACSYLAGSRYFSVNDIEVYRVSRRYTNS
eukprot:403337433